MSGTIGEAARRREPLLRFRGSPGNHCVFRHKADRKRVVSMANQPVPRWAHGPGGEAFASKSEFAHFAVNIRCGPEVAPGHEPENTGKPEKGIVNATNDYFCTCRSAGSCFGSGRS